MAEQLPGPRKACGLGSDLTGVTAFSPSDVWVFGGGGLSTGFGTWHFNGQTWTQVTGTAAGIFTASALSPANIWAIGSIKSPEDAIVHYNGTTWQHVTAPALKGLLPQQIVAASANSVWVTGTLQHGLAWRLLHFSNGQWADVTLPQPVTSLDSRPRTAMAGSGWWPSTPIASTAGPGIARQPAGGAGPTPTQA